MPDGSPVARAARFSFLITEKSVSDDQRIIRGIATSPRPDRLGDVVVMDGVESASDIPFMLHHDSRLPVGRAKLGKPTKAGIPFEARLPMVAEPGTLRDRVDEAWHSVKYGVITAVSIGFRVLDDAVEAIQGTNGLKFLKTEVMELSLVAVPAQPQAVITGFKSLDQKSIDSIYASIQAARPAATGNKGMPSQSTGSAGSPVASGISRETRPKGTAMKTIQELREERMQKSARIDELMSLRTSEDRRFTAEEAKEFDDLTTEIAELDDDIRVKQYEETNARTATPVRGKSQSEGTQSRGGMSFVRNADPEDKYKGQSFVRCQIAKAVAMYHGISPVEVARGRWGQTHPNLVNFIKATVAGGGTGSGEWGAELAQVDAKFAGDFVEYLYSRTVFDQLNLRAIPARVRVRGQDGAFTANWVGESKAIPMSKGDYSSVDLDPLKVAALTVISMELLEDSQPAAETLVRDGLVEATAQKIDTTFLSAAAASSGVSPAGILNGVSAISPSGTDLAAVRADLQSLMYGFTALAGQGSGISLVMNPSTALALSFMYGSLDQRAFPDINQNGGTLNGLRVIVGDNVTPGNIIAIREQDVWKIGDGAVRISMSREATIEQRDDPTGATDTPTGVTTTGLTNMFQEESVAFKVVRRINFQKRRSTAVRYISDAEYGGVVS